MIFAKARIPPTTHAFFIKSLTAGPYHEAASYSVVFGSAFGRSQRMKAVGRWTSLWLASLLLSNYQVAIANTGAVLAPGEV